MDREGKETDAIEDGECKSKEYGRSKDGYQGTVSMLEWVFGPSMELKIFYVVKVVVIVSPIKQLKLDEFLEGMIDMLF